MATNTPNVGSPVYSGLRTDPAPVDTSIGARVADVRRFGYTAGGSADNTAAVQLAIDAWAAGEYDLVQLPAGVVRVGTLELPARVGGWLRGTGPYLNPPHSGKETGTLLQAVSTGLPYMVNFQGTSHMRLSDFSIMGNTSNTATSQASRLFWLQNTPGNGAGELWLERINLYRAAIGFQAGGTEGGGASGADANNASDCRFRAVSFVLGDGMTGFKTLDDQQVLYSFYDCAAPFLGVVFDLVKGGSVTAVNLSCYDTHTVLRNGGGGPNVSFSNILGLKCDGAAVKTRAYVASAVGNPAGAYFLNPTFGVGQIDDNTSTYHNEARFQLKQGHHVIVDGGQGFCTADAPGLVSFDGGGTFQGRGLRIPSDSQHVLGSLSGDQAMYRFRDSLNADTGSDKGKFLDDLVGP
jgi:hypothetical protein